MRLTGSLFFLSFLIVTAIFVSAAAPSTQVIQGPEVEQFLKKARFTAREPLGSGVTGSWKVTLELDGKKEFAVMKTIDQKRPGAQLNANREMEIDFQDSWRTEVAAAAGARRSPPRSTPASVSAFIHWPICASRSRTTAGSGCVSGL